MNTMVINGRNATVQYDSEIELFRGEFIGLNGGADFYGADVATLKKEGQSSLNEFLAMCKEKGIEPYKHYSGKFNSRISPALHEQAVVLAASRKESLNTFVERAVAHEIQAKSL